MTTIDVDLSSVRRSGASGGDSGSGSEIAVLRRQITALQKQLTEVKEESSKDAVKKAKLIQQQIEVLQARIAQLLSEQAEKNSKNKPSGTEQASNSPVQQSLTTGNTINELV